MKWRIIADFGTKNYGEYKYRYLHRDFKPCSEG